MAETLNTPSALSQPIAQSGDKNTIPVTNDQSLGLMSQSTGFPPICSERIADGGKAPRRADFNGAFNLLSQQHYFFQNGGTETFRQEVSDAIGGYPLNARLWYLNENGESYILRSTKANNTDNFLTNPSVIGDSWVYDITTTSYVNAKINEIRTNCITNIPQDINLELTDGTLTLKSGSKVYTGTGKAININSNIVFHSGKIGSSNDSFFIFCNTSGGLGARVTSSQCISNSSNPGSGYYVWFDTTNNKVMYSANANGTFNTELSLPIGIYQRTNGNATSIKQVFNGFGYVANTVFALPDVEGLIPNGRNSDGTLNNYTYKVNNVIIRTGGTTYTGRYTVVGNAGDVFLLSSGYTYNYELNINENNGVKSNSCIIGTLDVSAGKITTFNIRKVFKAIDEFDYMNGVNDLSNYKASVNADNFTSTGKQTVVGWGMPDYSAGIGLTPSANVHYTAPSNGWIVASLSGNNSSARIIINENTNLPRTNSAQLVQFIYPVKKGDDIYFSGFTGIESQVFYPCLGG